MQYASYMWRMVQQHESIENTATPNEIKIIIVIHKCTGLQMYAFVVHNTYTCISQISLYQSLHMHELRTILDPLLKYHTYMKFEKIHLTYVHLQPTPSLGRDTSPVAPVPAQTHIYIHTRLAKA